MTDALGTYSAMKRPTTLAAALAVAAALAMAAATAQDATTTAADPQPAAPPGLVPNPASPAVSPEPLPSAEAAAATIPPASLPAGDAARGKGLTYTCIGCHGIKGYKNAYPNYHVPKIGGQSATFLRTALAEYKTGTRRHPTMQAQAQGFSDQDLADIAAYLSSIK